MPNEYSADRLSNTALASPHALSHESGGTDEVAHGDLAGLAGDDHTQYVAKAGRGGGQTIEGGTAAGEALNLKGTAHATVGPVYSVNSHRFSSRIIPDAALTPASLTVSTNNYAPSGIGTANVLRMSSTGNVDLTGILAPTDALRQMLFILNVGANVITLKNNSASSTAANRFLVFDDINIRHDEGIIAAYDATAARWRVFRKG